MPRGVSFVAAALMLERAGVNSTDGSPAVVAGALGSASSGEVSPL